MTTITTKFAAPTNTKGSRVIVKGFGKSKTVNWDHTLDGTDNHRAAMFEFLTEFNAVNGTDWEIKEFSFIDVTGANFVAFVK